MRWSEIAALGLAAALLATIAEARVADDALRRGGSPVVVELFTSQGCSSCPPADELISRLGSESEDVVALAFHVDYWNYLGWSDPFSSAEWSRRQEDYASHLGGSLYTPQAVVAGSIDALGSSERQLRSAIATAKSRASATIDLEVDRGASALRVGVDIGLPRALLGRRLALMIAVYESGLRTPVARGENGGRQLRNDFVVRALRRIGGSSGDVATTRFSGEIPLRSNWASGELGVAAFLQDPTTLEIVGAATRSRLPEP